MEQGLFTYAVLNGHTYRSSMTRYPDSKPNSLW